jgi:hypothetical protein
MTRAARIEGITQIVILLVMGVMAAAASFKHIHDLAVANGQPSWIGWVDAVVVELMSIVAGLENRRRKRTGQPTRFVHFVLYGAELISLAAQVAKAAPSVWGWIMAALPAAASWRWSRSSCLGPRSTDRTRTRPARPVPSGTWTTRTTTDERTHLRPARPSTASAPRPVPLTRTETPCPNHTGRRRRPDGTATASHTRPHGPTEPVGSEPSS